MATQLDRSHDILRAAVILTAREIVRLNFGKKDNRVVVKLWEILSDARRVRRSAPAQIQSRPSATH